MGASRQGGGSVSYREGMPPEGHPAKPTLPATGYTVTIEPRPGDATKNQTFPVVALVPVGRYGTYVAAVLDSRGNLITVDSMGMTYYVRAA